MPKFQILIPYLKEHHQYLRECIKYIKIAAKGYDVEICTWEDSLHRGVPRMLNRALDRCDAEYFGYFGADDLMHRNAFMNLENFNGDWCYGDCYQDGKPYYAGPFDKKRLKKENFIPAGSVFVRTEILKETRFNESLTFGEDWEMWLQLAKMDLDVRYINQFQYYYNTQTSTFKKTPFRKLLNKRKFR